MTDLSRAIAFQRWVLEATSTRTEPFRWGTVFFNDDFPRRYFSNLLWMDRTPAGATAKEVAGEADRLLAGLEHRAITFPDDGEGARLAAGFGEIGYTCERQVTMILRGEPDRPGEVDAVEEGNHAAVRDMLIETNRGDARSAPDAEMLADHHGVLERRIGARFFLRRIDGDVAGCCELFQRGDIAQVENVDTLERFRRRGVARSVILRAAAEAQAAGARLIFISALVDDWPKDLYARLGFQPVGYSRTFLKTPAVPPQATA